MSGPRFACAGVLVGGLALVSTSFAAAGDAGSFVKPTDTVAGTAGTFLKAPAPTAAKAGPLISIPGVKSQKAPRHAPAADAVQAERNPDAVVVGKPMPLKYMMLFDVAKYGLPKPRDGWVYFRADDQIYKVVLSSRIVLENVTDQATRPVK